MPILDTQVYPDMQKLLEEHKFASFTNLQANAFSIPEKVFSKQNLFIEGETSSGKTLIPLLIYEAALKKAKSGDYPYPKMLFLVPYRALASQKYLEFCEFFRAYPDLHIVLSTGEYRQDDDKILTAQVDIAVVIAEKVFKYEARDSSFLAQYDYLVIDEIGLLDSNERGVRLDFVITWARMSQQAIGQPRIIALGTPFYDWSEYIEGFAMHRIVAQDRKIKLQECTVHYRKKYIHNISDGDSFLKAGNLIKQRRYKTLKANHEIPLYPCSIQTGGCPIEEPARTNPVVLCPNTGVKCQSPIIFLPDDMNVVEYLLLTICQQHLKQGHQILIFVNNRESVKDYCRFLFHYLNAQLHPFGSPQECQKQILDKCHLDSEELFGVLEYSKNGVDDLELYQAFINGIGFHSAELPNELRTYVEKRLLDSELPDTEKMRIVCSTETLAFGVNSAVDTVIIADLQKFDNTETRMMNWNELGNYAGRAGRLCKNRDPANAKGYVYTLVSGAAENDWQKLQSKPDRRERMVSKLMDNYGYRLPFFLLNILPTNSTMSIQQMTEILSSLPGKSTSAKDTIAQAILPCLQYLEENALVVPFCEPRYGRNVSKELKTYGITELGRRLRGFILDRDEYDTLCDAMKKFATGIFQEPNTIDFLLMLLGTSHAQNGLNAVFKDSETRLNIDELHAHIASYAQEAGMEAKEAQSCRNEKLLSVLAAVLDWCSGQSPKSLCVNYGIHYAMLSRITERIAYLVEIAVALLPTQMRKLPIIQRLAALYGEVTIDDQIEKREEQMQLLSVSLYYGINTQIAQKLLDYLERESQIPGAAEKAKELNLKFIMPDSARLLRRIGIRYQFFATCSMVPLTEVQERNNYFNQRLQYRKDIHEMGSYIENFFIHQFGTKFTDASEENAT